MSRSSYHHGNLAEALELAAMELLAEKPAAEVSLREVARKAEVSHNAPYHHFGDRTQLLKVLAERSMAELVERVRVDVAEATDARDRAARVCATYVAYALERPHAFAAIYDPTICVPGSPTPTMAPLIDELEGVLTQTAAELHPDADPAQVAALASVMWSGAHGIATLGMAHHLSRDECSAAVANLCARLG